MICFFIPARNGSQRIKGKNTRRFLGLPLWEHTAQAACGAKVGDVIVSTDIPEIHETTNKKGGSGVIEGGCGNKFDYFAVNRREDSLYSDHAQLEEVLFSFLELEAGKYSTIVLLQPTSPQRTTLHILEALHLFKERKFDSLLSVVESNRFMWTWFDGKPGSLSYNPQDRPLSQNATKYYMENGAIYIFDAEYFMRMKKPCRIFGNIGFYVMQSPLLHSIEIDTHEDWLALEKLMDDQERFSNWITQ